MQITLGPCKSWTLSLIQAPQDTSAQVQGRSQLSFSRRILLSSSLMRAPVRISKAQNASKAAFSFFFPVPRLKVISPALG
ncbi:hypothetical protein C7424_3564 [Pantoea ananatis]|nr:hypothetical protein C7424_3564 [Pantoea ananatis]SKA77687.1 hypothetical protein SAMN03097719_3099 [Pantoea ananatis]